MKAELIADWRLRIADRTLITLPVTAIERILNERDRLLAALREIAGNDGSMSSHEMIFAAEDAIAYAESE